MIKITGFLHRKQFFDLVRRWVFNRMEPTDTDELLRLGNIKNQIVKHLPYRNPRMDRLIADLWSRTAVLSSTGSPRSCR